MLEPEASAVLRDRFVTELEDLSTGDDAAVWAHRSLPEKNKLTPADAQHVEEAFQAKLTTFAVPTVDQPETTRELEQASTPPASRPTRLPSRARERRIDKSRLPCRSRAASGTAITSGTLPSNPVSSVGEAPQTPTICASRNLLLSGARSVTSSRCRCVGGTIARFTAAAMKPHGGLRLRLIRELSPASCGLARIRNDSEPTSKLLAAVDPL